MRLIVVQVELSGVRRAGADEDVVPGDSARPASATDVDPVTVLHSPSRRIGGGQMQVASRDDHAARQLDSTMRADQSHAA